MQSASQIYEFGAFRLEVRERRLLRNGQPVPLRAKVFDTLLTLVANHGSLVTKDTLIRAVWPDAVVEEGNLAHNMVVLRKALGDKDTDQHHVETVPGKGYRFVASVRPVDARPSFTGAASGFRIKARVLGRAPGRSPCRSDREMLCRRDGGNH